VKKAVAIIVLSGNKILLGKKSKGANGQLSGKWHIPGETLEIKETDKQAAVRGIAEEAGIQIYLEKYVGRHYTINGTRVNWYLAKALTTNIRAGSDLESVKWAPVKKLNVMNGLKESIKLWPDTVKKLLGVS